MNRWLIVGASLLALSTPFAAQAQDKHDGNKLQKLGKAIAYPVTKAGKNAYKTARKSGKAVQYPVNKAGQNASITAHKVTGKNSVTTVKPTGRKAVITPSGDKKPVTP